MKILFATNHAYPPRRVGGSESSTHDLCLTLGESGIEVAVLSSSLRGRSTGRWDRVRAFPRALSSFVRDETAGYPVYRAPSPIAAARDVVSDLVPDVAVIQAGRPLALAERLNGLGVPCLVYLRDAFFDNLGGPVSERDDLRYIAVSRDLARRFAEAFGLLPESIPPLVRPERYRVDSTRRNVTFVCPFPAKGVDIALGLAERRPDIPFVFVESWELHPVRRLALHRRIRVARNISFRGPTGDMRGVYRDAKLVLVPSRCPEGWGRVVSEAHVSGIPALASDTGGLPESVGRGGILVDPDAGLERWERALARMWDDETEYARLAELARQHSRRPDFEPSATAAKLLPALSDLANAREVGVLAS
jgi:glycosyltransferase involved in cell wall biosynthesis